MPTTVRVTAHIGGVPVSAEAHTHGGWFYCKECSAAFRSSDQLVRHMNPHPLLPVADIPESRRSATRRTRVYVAGPMTGSGNPYANVWRGLDVAITLLDRGFAPYAPHLTSILEMTQGQRDRDVWLELDKAYLLVCDCLLRLDGVSPGADQEVAWARDAQIPVYYSLDSLLAEQKGAR
jgi:hypothetical protein